MRRQKAKFLDILDVLDTLSIWAGREGRRILYDELYGLDLDWTRWRLYLFSFVVLSVRTENTSFNCGL